MIVSSTRRSLFREINNNFTLFWGEIASNMYDDFYENKTMLYPWQAIINPNIASQCLAQM